MVCDTVVYVKDVVCVCVTKLCVKERVCDQVVCACDKVVCVKDCVWQSCV